MGINFSSFYPSEYADSIFSYDFAKAYADGKRLILFDIDNTLVPHGAPADQRTLELFRDLKDMGYSLCGISNNREPRVRKFCDAFIGLGLAQDCFYLRQSLGCGLFGL